MTRILAFMGSRVVNKIINLMYHTFKKILLRIVWSVLQVVGGLQGK